MRNQLILYTLHSIRTVIQLDAIQHNGSILNIGDHDPQGIQECTEDDHALLIELVQPDLSGEVYGEGRQADLFYEGFAALLGWGDFLPSVYLGFYQVFVLGLGCISVLLINNHDKLDKRRPHFDNKIININDNLIKEHILHKSVINFHKRVKNPFGFFFGVTGGKLFILGRRYDDRIGDTVRLVLVELEELKLCLVAGYFVCFLHYELEVLHEEEEGLEGFLLVRVVLDDGERNFLELEVYGLYWDLLDLL